MTPAVPAPRRSTTRKLPGVAGGVVGTVTGSESWVAPAVRQNVTDRAST